MTTTHRKVLVERTAVRPTHQTPKRGPMRRGTKPWCVLRFTESRTSVFPYKTDTFFYNHRYARRLRLICATSPPPAR